MKIKDLPEGVSLGGVQFIYPGDGRMYFWASQWEKGVWGKYHPEDQRLFPLFVEDISEVLEWEVVDGGEPRFKRKQGKPAVLGGRAKK